MGRQASMADVETHGLEISLCPSTEQTPVSASLRVLQAQSPRAETAGESARGMRLPKRLPRVQVPVFRP